MTLDDIEKLSRYIADNNGLTTDTPDHQLALGDRVKLARAVLAMLPVVKAAEEWREHGPGQSHCEEEDCPCTSATCQLKKAIDSLRSSMARLAEDV